MTGKCISVTVLFDKAIDVFKQEFGVMPNSIEEMEKVLKEKKIFEQGDIETEIPFFVPPSIDEIPVFFEIDIERITQDVPMEESEKARRQITRDQQELEQGNVIG